MKNTTGNNLKLGIFVSVSIALFISSIYFIGVRQQLFGNTFRISGIFKDISGLQVGNNVRFSGINVGIVENIEQITDSSVRVGMLIDVSTKKFIKKNAMATIGSDGLMGSKILLISPGTSGEKEIEDGDRIGTNQPLSMDDILLKLKVTTDNTANITGDLAGIMKNIHEGKGTLGKLIMDNKLAKNVDEALVNINHGADGFKQNMEAAKHNFLLRGFFKKDSLEKEKEKEKVPEEK